MKLFVPLMPSRKMQHHQLLYHGEVRWLSRSNVLSRLYELHDEVMAFLLEKSSPLAAKFSEEKWLARLAYLGDTFKQFNELNGGLQGKTQFFTLSNKLEAWIRELCLVCSFKWGRIIVSICLLYLNRHVTDLHKYANILISTPTWQYLE